MATLTVRALLASFACAYCISAASVQKLDSSWKTFSNPQLGFCVDYPSRWVRSTAFDGDGMYFETGVQKFSLPIGEIDVSVLRDKPLQTADYLKVHLEQLRKFERAEQLELLETRSITLSDIGGFLTRNRYFDPQDQRPWFDELVVVGRGDRLFRLELECRAESLPRFEPVFSRVLNSFHLNCNARRGIFRH